MSLVDSSKHVKRKIRKGRPSGPWITARKIAQYLSLAVFILLFLLSKQGGWPGDLVNLPMRLDPLLMLSHMLSGRVFLLGSTLALLTLIATLVFGRAWCGWVCPLGTVLDMVFRKSLERQATRTCRGLAQAKICTAAHHLIAALLGNLTLLVFLDPLSILFRSLSVAIWPAIDQTSRLLSALLYQVSGSPTRSPSLIAWIRPSHLPDRAVLLPRHTAVSSRLPGLIILNLSCAALLVPLSVPAGWLARAGEQSRPLPA